MSADKKTNGQFFLDGNPITDAEAKAMIVEFYKDRADEVFNGVKSGQFTGAVHKRGQITFKS